MEAKRSRRAKGDTVGGHHNSDGLTERQRDVLRLHQQGKSPTEIGKELEISSQGVHGHLRRLRDKGLIEGEPRRKPQPTSGAFDASMALKTVRETIAEQTTLIRNRQTEIDQLIRELGAERTRLDETLAELERLVDHSEGNPEPAAASS